LFTPAQAKFIDISVPGFLNSAKEFPGMTAAFLVDGFAIIVGCPGGKNLNPKTWAVGPARGWLPCSQQQGAGTDRRLLLTLHSAAGARGRWARCWAPRP
jgi:hypothetical protein